MALGNLAVSIVDKNEAAADVHGYVYTSHSIGLLEAGRCMGYVHIGVGFSVARSSAMGNARAPESRTGSEFDTRAFYV